MDKKSDSEVVENFAIGKLYENEVGAYVYNFFPFFFLSLMEYCWLAIFLFVYIFQLMLRESREVKKEISKFLALANSQERRKRK